MLVTRNIRKAFGATQALDGVSFSAQAGEVHALIGENGAGKSTLMNVLAGVFPHDSGELVLGEQPYCPTDPLSARRAGVAMVHQELSLCPHLSVEENIVLGAEPTRAGFIQEKERRAIATAALSKVSDASSSSALKPEARVGALSPAEQQLVEIARAVSHEGCRVVLFDEPTSSLARHDVDKLFSVIRSLKAAGMAILYISHFLEEVQEISDSFTVLRDGRTVGAGSMKEVAIPDIVGMMAGRAVEQLFPRSKRSPGEVLLEVRQLSGVDKPIGASLEIRRGEVLGIAGLVGAGRTELVRALYGLDPVSSGTVRISGTVQPGTPATRLEQGVGLVSEDRKGEGLATALSIADNLTLSKLTGLGPFGLVLPRRSRAVAAGFIERLKVKATGPKQPIAHLSGGNQQKVAIARLLYHETDLFLLDEPTRGIDVGSKAQIYALIDELALSGKAVLMISSYLPELFGVCDRIAVMCRGELGRAKPISELTEHDVLLEATNAAAPPL